MSNPKMLFFDIETAPAEVYVFQLWKPIIGMDQIIKPSRIIAWSAQWFDKSSVMFASEYHDGQDEMLKQLHALIDEADIIVTYNGKRFDEPWVQGEFIKAELPKTSPVNHLDLYQIAKSNMRNLSGKLDYLSLILLDERKVSHPGFKLWRDCIGPDGDAKDKAWRLMKKYAIQDTKLLKPLYERLLPYIKNHPNVALYTGEQFACPACGGTHLQKRGYHYTGASKFKRYQCMNTKCGKWSHDSRRVATTELRA
jgi:uncharacterized protein YprB with RNaseH-like and TPR domain